MSPLFDSLFGPGLDPNWIKKSSILDASVYSDVLLNGVKSFNTGPKFFLKSSQTIHLLGLILNIFGSVLDPFCHNMLYFLSHKWDY